MFSPTPPFPTPARSRPPHPSAAATPDEGHRAVPAGRFTPFAAGPSDPPSAAQAFFDRVFASDAAERPPSARALFGDLERALA